MTNDDLSEMNDDLSEIMVDRFYDNITEAEKRVMHACWLDLSNQKHVKAWEWELAGTYIIADSEGTIAIASDGLRMARYTAPPAEGIGTSQLRGFLSIYYRKGCENETFYDTFTKILTTWNVVKDATIYNRNDLIKLLNGPTTTRLGVTVNTKHILDFCDATQQDLITCQAVVNQSCAARLRLKLIAGQLEELFIPSFSVQKMKFIPTADQPAAWADQSLKIRTLDPL